MLNYETLLSSYDDKLTLMQWLKKVEAALKDASAVSFNVNKRGDATLTFSVVFEDGSELETAPIILQQGESVQAAAIRNGHLILTLTNGDELDAGDLGGVSGFSIDASQHLIVTYQSGRTQDLGAIFSGNVVISGNFEVTGLAKLPSIEGDENGNINVDGDIVISDGGISIADGEVSTPILTSANDHIEAQKPVVEVMTGYSFTKGADTSDYTLSYAYAGIVKNGNKITLAVAFEISLLSNIGFNQQIQLGRFNIPSAIGQKLFPFSQGGFTNLVAQVSVLANETSSALSGILNSFAVISKVSDTRLDVLFYPMNNGMSAGEHYNARVEVTFLLSENLAA